MLSVSVLCMKKKRKKRIYQCDDAVRTKPKVTNSNRRLGGGSGTNSIIYSQEKPTMMHITEDTPPDMLAGAMDLTVHLPSNRSVKMSVERSTPMMDLLVHITSAHQLQLSNHIIQALEMAPSFDKSDKVLPYKPNTPIGALDTQHIRVIAKNKPVSVPKNLPPGYQPFESTFRLQVHLPRNQLYVIRVSQHVFLENILKRVCEEKNLDIRKYELRHPGNLDEILNLKLTLSDYKITEIYVVAKGTIGLAQTFSSSDIMALKKEEEKKQMQSKTGGGVFSLIFKKGKPSTGSGSLSSENRSISPVHSDDSRSVTPPSIQPPLSKERPLSNERPKPPQRKRRPAPKPPQKTETQNSKPSSQVSTNSEPATILDLQPKNIDNGLTICHSRNSSDSSGYHEPSVLSENCNNASLPRRPKSAVVNVVEKGKNEKGGNQEEVSGNLSKMAGHSKSLSSLVAGRKKRAAPPPPPVKIATSTTNLDKVPSVDVTLAKNVEKQRPAPATPKIFENPSPVIASLTSLEKTDSPKPTPRTRIAIASIPPPETKPTESAIKPLPCQNKDDNPKSVEIQPRNVNEFQEEKQTLKNVDTPSVNSTNTKDNVEPSDGADGKTFDKMEATESVQPMSRNLSFDTFGKKEGIHVDDTENISCQERFSLCSGSDFSSINSKLTEAVNQVEYMEEYETLSNLDMDMFKESLSKNSKISKKIKNELCGIQDLEMKCDMRQNRSLTSLSNEIVPGFVSNMKKWRNVQDLDDISWVPDNTSLMHTNWVVGNASDTESVASMCKTQTSVGTVNSLQTPEDILPIPKEIENHSNNKEINNVNINEIEKTPIAPKLESSQTITSSSENHKLIEEKDFKRSLGSSAVSNGLKEVISEKDSSKPLPQKIEKEVVPKVIEKEEKLENVIIAKPPSDVFLPDESNNASNNELEIDWQYQLPPPPSAFRDECSSSLAEATNYDTVTLDGFKTVDSIVTQSELFEKLQVSSKVDTISTIDANSVQSEDDKEICSKLSLEILEKRRSLVYNRELTTSLKVASEERFKVPDSNLYNEDLTLSRNQHQFEKKASPHDTNLPNFKIATYNNPKQKINIFEDESVRSNTENGKKMLTEENQNRFYQDEFDSGDIKKELTGFSQKTYYQEPIKRSNHQFQKLNETPYGVSRSESFSNNNISNTRYFRRPSHPVKRSKSQVALNNYKEQQKEKTETGQLSRANSLFDVSGLQSLEVMRVIQNKLNSSNDLNVDTSQHESIKSENNNNKSTTLEYPHSLPPQTLNEQPPVQINSQIEPEKIPPTKPDPPKETASSQKTYSYQGPPSICLSTWSERPKTQVSLKEDTDYIVNSKNNINSLKSNAHVANNSMQPKDNDSFFKVQKQQYYMNGSTEPSHRGINVKINGTDVTSQLSSSDSVEEGSKFNRNVSNTFINYSTASSYRKPLGNVNEKAPRPHSIAFDSSFDITRVPMVRSVEFKKDVQLGKSDTLQNKKEHNGNEKFADIYQSSDSLNELNQLKNKRSTFYVSSNQPFTKPVARINSFGQVRQTPTVMGFRSDQNPPPVEPKPVLKTPSFRVPSKQDSYSNSSEVQNKRHTIFGDVVLRKTSYSTLPNSSFGNRLSETDLVNNNRRMFNGKADIKGSQPPPPPPAPQLPRVTSLTKKSSSTSADDDDGDSRGQLLDAIRNFGGKKNLRRVRT